MIKLSKRREQLKTPASQLYEDRHNNVFYEEISSDFPQHIQEKWAEVRDLAVSDFSPYHSKETVEAELTRAKNTLKSQAEVLRNREIKFLETFFGITVTGDGEKLYKNLTKSMTMAFSLKDLYNRTVKTATSLENDLNRNDGDGNKFGIQSPSAIMIANMKKSIELDVKMALDNLKLSMGNKKTTFKDIEGLLQRIIQDRVIYTLVNMNLGQRDDDFKPLRQILEGAKVDKMEGLMEQLQSINTLTAAMMHELGQRVYTNYGFDKVLANLTKEFSPSAIGKREINKIRSNLLTTKVKTVGSNSGGQTILEKMNITNVSYGVVDEALNSALQSLASKTQGKDHFLTIAHTRNSSKSDAVAVYAKGKKRGKKRGTEQTFAQLTANFEATIGSNSGATKDIKLASTLRKEVDKLEKEGFSAMAVYMSDKSYKLGGTEDAIKKSSKGKVIKSSKIGAFKGFQGSSYLLGSTFRNFLRDMQVKDAEKFLGAVKQLAPGAIYNDTVYRENIESHLAKYTANFLFEDFRLEGSKGHAKSIHLYRLNNVIVPLSYILQGMADALDKSIKGNFLRFHIQNNGVKQLYPTSYYNGALEGREKSKQASRKRWSAQNTEAEKMKVSITFLQNFREFLSKLEVLE